MEVVDDSGIDCEVNDPPKSSLLDVHNNNNYNKNKVHNKINNEDLNISDNNIKLKQINNISLGSNKNFNDDKKTDEISFSNDLSDEEINTNNSNDNQIEKSSLKEKSQRKLDKHSANYRRYNMNNNQNSRHQVISRNRLLVPSKADVSSETDIQPLVIIDIDDSEDEFAIPKLSKKAQTEMMQQLTKDGYNLDIDPDDDDLDLIPPRPLNERCICCNRQINCVLM